MKKYLLLSAAAMAATAGFAQVASVQMQKVSAPAYAPMQKCERMTANNAVKKSYSNQTYYIPQDGLFAGWNIESRGTGSALLVVPAFTDITYKNMMSTPANGVWTVNSRDVTSYAVDGNYVQSYGPQGSYYAPTLVNGTVQYQFGENAYYYKTGTITDIAQAGIIKTYQTVQFTDGSMDMPLYGVNDHGYRESNGRNYQNTLVGYGFLEKTAFLFGTGTYSGTKASSATQYFNACSAPIYANDIFVRGLTFNENGPIPANDTIYAYITDADEVYDDEGNLSGYKLGSNVYATLYATAETVSGFTQSSDDVITSWDASTDEYEGKNPTTGTVVYYNTQKTIDPIMGTESSDPVVIPAGKAFAITLADVDKDGVCLGFPGTVANDEDNSIQGTVNMADGNSYLYRSNIGIPVAIEGMFEKMYVPETNFLTYESETTFPTDKFTGWNVLRVSADGQTVTTDGLSGTDFDLGSALIGTTFPWSDENDNSNYSVEVQYLSGEDWVTGVNVSTDLYSGDNLPGYNLVTPVCSALPTGTTGRIAKLIVHGKADIACETPIYVLQGDAKATDGIKNAVEFDRTNVENNAMFNLSGQKVSNNYKGIVIQNGKKFLNK